MASAVSQGRALTGITKVSENDIICGRGALPMKHPGNKVYRNMIGLNKELYVTCPKSEKLLISKSIVAAIREIKGRFLEREDGKTGKSFDDRNADGSLATWRDVGDKRATEKTSQALREGQPKLLKKLTEQKGGCGAMVGVPPHPQQQVRDNFSQHQYQRGFQSSGGMSHPAMAPDEGAQRTSDLSQIFMEEVRNSKDLLRNNDRGREVPPLEDELDIVTQPSQYREVGRLPPISNGDAVHLCQIFMEDVGRNSKDLPQNHVGGRGQTQANGEPYFTSRDEGAVDIPQSASVAAVQNKGTRRSSVTFQLPPSPQNADEALTQRTSDLLHSNGEEGGQGQANRYFSNSDAQPHFTTGLNMGAGDVQRAASDGAILVKGPKRSSVTFQLPPSLESSMRRSSMSGMSMVSRLSGLFSEVLSLDTAMDAAQRDAEFDMLGEDDEADALGMSMGTFRDPSPEAPGSAGSPPRSAGPKRGSILRTCGRRTSVGGGPSFQTAPAGGVDPGLIFTSTLDARPGGVNAGTDVSGLFGERRKSAIALEVDMDRRRSSLMSTCSALTNFSERFTREMGSMFSIQSTEIRELMDEIASDDDDDLKDEDSIGETAPV